MSSSSLSDKILDGVIHLITLIDVTIVLGISLNGDSRLSPLLTE